MPLEGLVRAGDTRRLRHVGRTLARDIAAGAGRGGRDKANVSIRLHLLLPGLTLNFPKKNERKKKNMA